jgi:predicted metal-dependent phosphotriesterase family hydrolase
MDDVQEMARELEMFRAAGGATVCELSCVGVRCSPHSPGSLAQLSRLSGVHIVHATGFYCHTFLPETVHGLSVDEMTQTMMDGVYKSLQHLHTLSALE